MSTRSSTSGSLRRLDKRATAGQPARFEVQRIIKAFVDGQWLAEFDQRLAEYRRRLDPGGAGDSAPSEEGGEDDE